jgi:hypothetical protein
MKDREGNERKCEEEDKCGQKKDIEGASRRTELIFHEKENLKFKKI